MVTNTMMMTLSQMKALAQETSNQMSTHQRAADTLHRELTALRDAIVRDKDAGLSDTDFSVVEKTNQMTELSRLHADHSCKASDARIRLDALRVAIEGAEEKEVAA